MAVQTDYEETQPAAVAGALATMLRGDLISRNVEGAAIGFGRAVAQGATDKGCIAFAGGVVLGITVLDRSASGQTVVDGQVTGRTADAFGVGESARIAAVGGGSDIWVVCATGCSAGDGVFVRPSNGDFQDSDANTAVAIPGARWDTSAGAGELAVVRLA